MHTHTLFFFKAAVIFSAVINKIRWAGRYTHTYIHRHTPRQRPNRLLSGCFSIELSSTFFCFEYSILNLDLLQLFLASQSRYTHRAFRTENIIFTFYKNSVSMCDMRETQYIYIYICICLNNWIHQILCMSEIKMKRRTEAKCMYRCSLN